MKISKIKGQTRTGFNFEITKSSLENYELIEALGELEESPLALPRVVRLLLGDKAEDLKDHVRDNFGLVPVNALSEEIKDIFGASQDIKN